MDNDHDSDIILGRFIAIGRGEMRTFFIFCLFFLACSPAAHCGQTDTITLTDGSVIRGEILSYAGGTYTIKSDTIGQIRVDSSRVSRIESGHAPFAAPASGTGPSSSSLKSDIEGYQATLLKNPEVARMITGLATDPELRELLKDPEIAAAANADDIEALMSNQKLMSVINPKIQEIIKTLKR